MPRFGKARLARRLTIQAARESRWLLAQSRREEFEATGLPVQVKIEETGGDVKLLEEDPLDGGGAEKGDFGDLGKELPWQCLLCYKTVDWQDKIRHLKASEIEGTFTVMFVLKKMLSLSNDKLARYLKERGSPKSWISFCKKCVPLVEEAVGIQKEIGELERRLKDCQKKMISKIRKTWSVTQDTPGAELWATHETRKFVVGLTNPYKKESFLEKRKLKEPETVASPVLPPPPPGNGVPRKRKQELPLKEVEMPLQEIYEDGDNADFDFDGADSRSSVEGDTGVPGVSTKNCHSCSLCPARKLTRKQLDAHFNEKHRTPPLKATPSISPTPKITESAPISKTYGDDDKIEFYFHKNASEAASSVESVKEDDVIKTETAAQTSGKFSCHLCPYLTEMSTNTLVNHVMFHYKKPYQCFQCGIYYSTETEVVNSPYHKLKANAHQCSKSDLVPVKFLPDTLTFWKCGWCQDSFNSEPERDLHESHAHPEDPLRVPQKKHKCSSCSLSFRNLAEWRFHRVLEHPEVAAFSCDYCDVTFKSKSKDGIEYMDRKEMMRHQKTEHKFLNSTKHPFPSRVSYECLLCGLPLSTQKSLNEHVESVHEVSKDDSLACPVCPKRKHCSKLLITHFKMHRDDDHPQQANICDLCGYTVKHKTKFQEHQFLQHGMLPENREILKCSKEPCSFQCVNKNTLDVHGMKEHGGERKHKCRHCGKGFLNSRHRLDHERIHTNATLKPYQCEICGNSFAVKNYLYIHMRLSHQNRPFASTHKKRPRKRAATTKEPLSSGPAIGVTPSFSEGAPTTSENDTEVKHRNEVKDSARFSTSESSPTPSSSFLSL